MKKKIFKIKNKVWIWPGESANWFFIYVDGKVKDQITKHKKGLIRGMVKVRATLCETTWETALFKNKREKCFLLPLKKLVRKKEDIFDGDVIEVKLELM